MGDIPNWGKYGGNFCLVEVVSISIDVYCTAGVGVRPKSDGYGYEVPGNQNFLLIFWA